MHRFDLAKPLFSVLVAMLLAGATLAERADAREAPRYASVKAAAFKTRQGIGNALAMLNDGKAVRVAYLGGSITAARGWRVKTTAMLKQRYPKAEIHEINAAIGGTGSDLGVYRLERDVLRHKPDLLFVEFAVNDGGAPPQRIWQAMEGIVRQTWTANPRCDICFVYTFRVNYENDLRKGICPRAASADEMLAEHYGIPSINVALPIVQWESRGKLIFKGERGKPAPKGITVFSHDGVHPLDAGHELYTQTIGEAFTAWQGAADKDAMKPVNHGKKLKTPFVEDHWQAAKLVAIKPSMLKGNWTKLDPGNGLGKRFGIRMDAIWQAGKPGSKLTFKFRGSAARIYDLLGPDGGQVIVTVDGKSSSKPRPRFDSYCTYHRLATLHVAEGLDPTKVHTVTIEIHPEQPSRQPVAFRLKDPEKELKSAKYQGTNVWFGALMLRGDLVE